MTQTLANNYARDRAQHFFDLQTEQAKSSGELLFSVFTHEIANSLQDICSLVTVMQQHLHQNGRVDPPVGDALRLVSEEVKRLALLLEEFRSSRLFNLHLRPTSLAEVIEDCLRLESAKAAERNVRIECDIPLNLPPITADPAKLKQVFLNLYTNAIEAMPYGGRLTVKAFELGDKVRVDFSDTGGGVPEDMEIFEPFVTSKPRGTSLGLAIVKRIVLAHGGTIGYRNKSGKGTVFQLAFQSAGAT